jgi:hypothetical protein
MRAAWERDIHTPHSILRRIEQMGYTIVPAERAPREGDADEVLARLRSTTDAEVRDRTALLDAEIVRFRKALRAYFKAVDDIRDAGEARGGDPGLISAMYRNAGKRQREAEAILRAAIKEAPRG